MTTKTVYDPKTKKIITVDTGSKEYKTSPEIQRLVQQNERLGQHVEQLGGKPSKGHPSIFSRVTDVLSRPLYASAGAVFEGAKKNKDGTKSLTGVDLGKALGGVVHGLSGTQKHTYGDVVNEVDKTTKGKTILHNKYVKIGAGLGLDLLADPLNAAGAGIVKAPSEIDKGFNIAKATSEAAKLADSSAEAARVEHAGKLAFANGKLLKGAIDNPLKSMEAAGKTARAEYVATTAQAAAKTAEDANALKKGAVTLRLGPFEHGFESLYHVGSNRFTKKLLNSPYAQQLNKNFRTAGTYGTALNEERKIREAGAVGNYDTILNAARPVAGGKNLSWIDVEKGLSPSERKTLAHAIEHQTVSQLPEFSKKGFSFQDAADVHKHINTELFNQEMGIGLHAGEIKDAAGNVIQPATKELDNYVYHHYNNYSKAKAKAFKTSRIQAVGPSTFNPAAERTFKTLEDAAKAGLKPETDLSVLVRNRVAKHARGSARAEFLKQAVDNFGIRADKATIKLIEQDGTKFQKLGPEELKIFKNPTAPFGLKHGAEDIYIHPEIAHALGAVTKVHENPGEFVQLADKVINKMWKPAATVYNPGHHVRNFASDVYLNYVDGVRDPRVYAHAIKMTMAKEIKGSLKIGDVTYSNHSLMDLFKRSGAAPGFIETELGGQGLKRISGAAHKFSEGREETGRLAHYIDAIKKEGAGAKSFADVEEAGLRAAQRVKKWNVDYSDLTDFEKTYMKRVVPFYTWLRKSSPLMVEAAFTRPGKVVSVSKGLNALERLANLSPEDKLPTDMIPKWIREVGGIQIGNSSRGNPLFFNNPLPIMDPIKTIEGGKEGVLRNALSQINPIAKAPFEQATGKNLFNGAPLQGGAQGYALNQVPLARLLAGLIKNKGNPDKDHGSTQVLNYLTGAGIQEATPSNLKGEQQRQMDSKRSYVKAANKSANKPNPKGKLVYKNGKLVWTKP